LFQSAHLKPNQSGADKVYGKPNLTDNSATACEAGQMVQTFGVYYDDNTDTLFAGDLMQNRILIWDLISNLSSGANATGVIGQPTLTSGCGGIGISSFELNFPKGVVYSEDLPGIHLLVADTDNMRFLRFECSNFTFSRSLTLSQTVAASVNVTSVAGSVNVSSVAGSVVVSSGVPSSVVLASSSGVVASTSGVAVASSSGVVAGNSSGVVAASSSGAVAGNSSGVAASSSGAVAASSSGVAATSGPALSITATTSTSQSNTPSETNPQNTATATPIAPPPVQPPGASVKPAVCGNGAIETGEECDAGSAVPRTKCCTSFCTSLPVRSICGRATSQCTKRPKCGRSLNSRQLVCNPGVAKPVGTHCGKGGIFSRKTCKADGSCSK